MALIAPDSKPELENLFKRARIDINSTDLHDEQAHFNFFRIFIPMFALANWECVEAMILNQSDYCESEGLSLDDYWESKIRQNFNLWRQE